MRNNAASTSVTLRPVQRRVVCGLLVLMSVVAVGSLSPVCAEDWQQFLGPDRNGVSTETGLISSWPEGGLPVAWRQELGVGMSGIAVVGDQLFTLYQDSDSQFVVSLDTSRGEKNWETAIAPRYRNAMGNGPRATPTWSEGRLFVYSGEGKLVALDAESGAILWQHEPVLEFEGEPAEYGMACSPLVLGEQVIVTVGAPQATLASYSTEDGSLLWQAKAEDAQDRAGYSSPALLNVNGESQLVALTGTSVLGVRPDSGQVLWRFPYQTDYDCNTATPISIDGRVFISSGENHGAVLLEVTEQGDSYRASAVWESLGRDSIMRNEWQTSIVWEAHMYGLDNVGSAGPVTHLSCVSLENGEVVWREERFGKSNMIAADGKLFFSTMEGELVVVRLNSERFEEMGRVRVLETTRQAPTLSNGMLFMRDDQHVIAIDVSE